MANGGPERGQPVLLQPAEKLGESRSFEPHTKPVPPSALPLILASVLAVLWLGAAGAYLWGFYGSAGLAMLALPQMVVMLLAAVLPPVLIVATAWAFTRGDAMNRSALALAEAAERLFTADETAARTAARLGRAVRREIDALNTGLDSAFSRLRTLESALETQIAAIDEAGARAQVRAEAVSAQLSQERDRLDTISDSLADAATRAGEFVAGRAAQLKATLEAAEGALRAAGNALDVQTGNFRTATNVAAEVPNTVAAELDRQAKRIEAVSDAAMARAEFVLGRHERHRAAMQDLLARMKDEGAGFEQGLAGQRETMEQAIAMLHAEAESFVDIAADAQQNIDQLMASAAARAGQLTAAYGREAERLREAAEMASGALSTITAALRDAGTGAQALIGETANEAKANAKALVGEAMGECQRLLHASASLAAQAGEIKVALAEAAAEVERHLLTLPGVAQQEAARVRDMVKSETDEILDLSARTLSTIHARTAQRGAVSSLPQQGDAGAAEGAESDGLRGLARKFTQRPRRKEEGKWEMSQLLAAAELGGRPRALKPNAAAALGALQAALADLAIDLDAIAGDEGPGEEEWKRYVSGDRSVFARRLAQAVDAASVDRIATLYRENARFREATNTYLAEFETMLEQAYEGDGGGLLASSLLSADTGKIYLSVAYALGRLA